MSDKSKATPKRGRGRPRGSKNSAPTPKRSRAKAPPNTERVAFSIIEFCNRNGISEGNYRLLREAGKGPKEMRPSGLPHGTVLISAFAEAAWQRDCEKRTIPEDVRKTTLKASRLIHEFVLPHGLELYQSAGGGEARERGRKIASYVLTSGKGEFTSSDFTRNVWALVGMAVFDLVRAVSPLVAWGWLDLDSRNPNAPRWKLRPGVAEAMRERRETEERESQALSNAMDWKRRPHKWN